MITKDKAREILSEYLESNPLPIKDVVIHTSNDFEEYTFRGLLMIAYDLNPTEP